MPCKKVVKPVRRREVVRHSQAAFAVSERRRSSRYRVGRAAAQHASEVWAIDFVSDRLFDDLPIRILTFLNCRTREALATWARTNFRAHQVTEGLDRLVAL